MFITFKHKQNKLPVKKINSLLQSFPRKPGKLKETENNWREKKTNPKNQVLHTLILKIITMVLLSKIKAVLFTLVGPDTLYRGKYAQPKDIKI